MKRIIFYCLFSVISVFPILAQMSDNEVMSYVKQEYAKGSTQEQIASYLMRKGVTKEQLERIKSAQQTTKNTKSSDLSTQPSNTRLRTDNSKKTKKQEVFDFESLDLNSKDSLDVYKDKEKEKKQIFGHNIFNNKNLSFSPILNIATPANYRLGPGDEVIIDIWGASQNTLQSTISPDGSIVVDRLGPIYLSGMSINEANKYIQKKFASIYAGLNSPEGESQIKLSLGQIRTIQVNVMGEVTAPGTYDIPSLSTVFQALYQAQGVNDIGSMRKINLYRNGKLLKSLDLYKYILDGRMSDDIRLNDGDVIVVPTFISLVNVNGQIKRPMFYEMLPSENLSDLLNYAGGFDADGYRNKIEVFRKTGKEKKIFTVDDVNFNSFTIANGDSIIINSGLDLFENRVQISGAVFRPGSYEIGDRIETVKQLVEAADGIKGDAFLGRAILTREKEDYTLETVSINLSDLLYGSGDDIPLRKNDILYIPSNNDLAKFGDFVVFGEVNNPGYYEYAANTTLEDLIIQAGGLLPSASIARVDIARRIIDPSSIITDTNLSENYIFDIKDGLILNGQKGFILKPYDQIYIRRSPGYHPQQNVIVEGEVLFPGEYALSKKTERISELIVRAGNLTKSSYTKGARLVRTQTDEELQRQKTALKIAAKSNKDSISVKSLDLAMTYDVGIELDKAIAYPGSDYDIVLRANDKIIVPEYSNTVKINGAVMYPNTVVYKEGEKVDYYINQAGGYADNAKKKKAFVIYMNGTVSKVKGSDKFAIRPGSEIIVPTKEQSRRLSIGEMISIGSSVTSMASVVGLLINNLSK